MEQYKTALDGNINKNCNNVSLDCSSYDENEIGNADVNLNDCSNSCIAEDSQSFEVDIVYVSDDDKFEENHNIYK